MQAIAVLREWLNGSEYRPQTRKDFAVVLKRYYQWRRAPPQKYPRWRRRHIYPPEVEDLSTTLKFSETVLPADLLTAEEVSRLLSSTGHPMFSAYIALSDEVGPRAGLGVPFLVRKGKVRRMHDTWMARCRRQG